MLAMAVLLSSARSYIRLRKFKRLFADDGFLFLAVIALIAGTIILYADVPAIYTINDVLAGVEKAPIDFSDQLIQDHGFQVAASSLEMLAVFSVKFSFLFFFRSLIRRIPYLTIWWWCILACLVPTALICIFSGFLGCRDFGAQALSESHIWFGVKIIGSWLWPSMGLCFKSELKLTIFLVATI